MQFTGTGLWARQAELTNRVLELADRHWTGLFSPQMMKGTKAIRAVNLSWCLQSFRLRQVTYNRQMALWQSETEVSRYKAMAKSLREGSRPSYHEKQQMVWQILVIQPGLLCCRQVKSNRHCWWDDRWQLCRWGRDKTSGELIAKDTQEDLTGSGLVVHCSTVQQRLHKYDHHGGVMIWRLFSCLVSCLSVFFPTLGLLARP